MNATTLELPRMSEPVSVTAADLARQLAGQLTTIVEWGLYVDQEFGMTPHERDLWCALVVARDAFEAVEATQVPTGGAG